ncbi:hypothetical protein CEP49_01445 [Mergibacter septicus]|uniref:nicotinamide phosphoribosyltransferase domain-containing protein n=1 Tax=Mergibacter septicus TaxID=221402 RepID=UPI0011791506|nr:nicotinamide phosphoribosyltransferase domain-containing protein [Mergibacter septicus]AWX13302.1 hypothetical protein CEP49_01445 [Mergibacter septicus]
MSIIGFNTVSPLGYNLILDADAYKNDHGRMLPANTHYIFSTISARKASGYNSHIVAFGIRYLIQTYISQPITQAHIDQAEYYITLHGYQFDRQRWQYIVDQHQGILPLQITAIAEGNVVPVGVPLVNIVNTDPNCAWLVSYIETLCLRVIWYMTTVASDSFALKVLLESKLRQHNGITGNFSDLSAYHLHNFGARSCAGHESEIMSGMAHALCFKGSDSMTANLSIDHYYYPQHSGIAFVSSVIASEHSVSSANSNTDTQDDFGIAVKMLDLLDQEIMRKKRVGDESQTIISVVIDTYDPYRFVKQYIGERLKSRVEQLKENNARLVLRVDSGNPIEEPIKIIQLLMTQFGYHTNAQGYKELPPYLGVLQGDGVEVESIQGILERLEAEKLSLNNLVFGMGGKLTHPTKGRDTYSFAMKSTALGTITEKGEVIWQDLFKNPITDRGKRSLKGRFTTMKNHQTGEIQAISFNQKETALKQGFEDLMIEVFNGKKQLAGEPVIFTQDFEDVRLQIQENLIKLLSQ